MGLGLLAFENSLTLAPRVTGEGLGEVFVSHIPEGDEITQKSLHLW